MAEATWTTERREVSGFERVLLRHVGRLTLTPGQTISLAVTAVADLQPKIQTEVRANTLHLEIGRGWLERVLTRLTLNRSAVHYELTVPTLSELVIVGRGQVDGQLPAATTFSLRTSGVATVALTDLQLEALSMRIDGQAEVALSGRTNQQVLHVNGTGSVSAVGLASQIAQVTISGRADLAVAVSQELRATISGMGTVRYRGQPAVHQHITGMGAVEPMDD